MIQTLQRKLMNILKVPPGASSSWPTFKALFYGGARDCTMEALSVNIDCHLNPGSRHDVLHQQQ